MGGGGGEQIPMEQGIPESLSPLPPSLQRIDSPYREYEIRELVGFLKYFPNKTTETGKGAIFTSTAGLNLRDPPVPEKGLAIPSPLGSPHPVKKRQRPITHISCWHVEKRKNLSGQPLSLSRPFLQGLPPNL